MDYEKKYKDALERAKIYSFDYPTEVVQDTVTDIFPELKESADKKIRKNLITFFKEEYGTNSNARFAGIKVKDVIAWLEKQGQQRTTDKVETKFQNGQWIVWQNQCYKVNFLNGRGYELILQNGLITSIEYGAVDKSAHLWTIEDAKDGDVLSVTMYSGVWIGIFKEYNGRTFSSYCFMNTEGIFHFGASGHGRVEAIHPATQEQRDLLLQKMKEAGYEFDFYKKELKKIE